MGKVYEGNDDLKMMREMIEKYSVLPGFAQQAQKSHEGVVVVSHVLYKQ